MEQHIELLNTSIQNYNLAIDRYRLMRDDEEQQIELYKLIIKKLEEK